MWDWFLRHVTLPPTSSWHLAAMAGLQGEILQCCSSSSVCPASEQHHRLSRGVLAAAVTAGRCPCQERLNRSYRTWAMPWFRADIRHGEKPDIKERRGGFFGAPLAGSVDITTDSSPKAGNVPRQTPATCKEGTGRTGSHSAWRWICSEGPTMWTARFHHASSWRSPAGRRVAAPARGESYPCVLWRLSDGFLFLKLYDCLPEVFSKEK